MIGGGIDVNREAAKSRHSPFEGFVVKVGRSLLLLAMLPGLGACSSLPFGSAFSAPTEPVATIAPAPAPQKPAIAGPLAGALGAGLTDADRQTAFDAELAALSAGQRKSWRGNPGVFGVVEPEAESGGCRAYSETLYRAGRPKTGHGQGCRQADGAWKITG